MALDTQTDVTQWITVCTSRRRNGTTCKPGMAFLNRLNKAMTMASKSGAPSTFEISGAACMAGCSRPCTVAYLSNGKTSYLFGDVDPDDDIEALAAFADQYRRSGDGWTKAPERPVSPRKKTLARLPGSLIISQNHAGPAQ